MVIIFQSRLNVKSAGANVLLNFMYALHTVGIACIPTYLWNYNKHAFVHSCAGFDQLTFVLWMEVLFLFSPYEPEASILQDSLLSSNWRSQ